jgi:hypothetical protein
MGKDLRFGVKFIGYSAEVIALKGGNEIDYATIDFVSGAVILKAEHGYVMTPKRIDLAPFVASLPQHVDELRASLNACATDETDHYVELAVGENLIKLRATAEIDRVIKQLRKRCSEVEEALRQVEEIGSRIKRRPYDEFIEEIGSTGISGVELYGWGMFQKGRLSFRPERRTLLVKPVGPTQFEVNELRSSPGIEPYEMRLGELPTIEPYADRLGDLRFERTRSKRLH